MDKKLEIVAACLKGQEFRVIGLIGCPGIKPEPLSRAPRIRMLVIQLDLCGKEHLIWTCTRYSLSSFGCLLVTVVQAPKGAVTDADGRTGQSAEVDDVGFGG